MTGADLLNGLREAEYALWWAMRDTQQIRPDTIARLHTSLFISLDEIETHIASIRAMVASVVHAPGEAG